MSEKLKYIISYVILEFLMIVGTFVGVMLGVGMWDSISMVDLASSYLSAAFLGIFFIVVLIRNGNRDFTEGKALRQTLWKRLKLYATLTVLLIIVFSPLTDKLIGKIECDVLKLNSRMCVSDLDTSVVSSDQDVDSSNLLKIAPLSEQ